MTDALDHDARVALLPALDSTGWRAVPDRDAIRKIWKFNSFSEAWGFMAQAALLAEKMNHHPDWTNRYNIVDVTLTTHSCDALSVLDIELARALDAIQCHASHPTDHAQPIACLCQTPQAD